MTVSTEEASWDDSDNFTGHVIDLHSGRGRPDVEFEISGRSQCAGGTWYRGDHCNFNPTTQNMRSSRAVEDLILAGWLPPDTPDRPGHTHHGIRELLRRARRRLPEPAQLQRPDQVRCQRVRGRHG